MTTIGFCGLGLMGSRMASRLLAAGHTLQVWNRSPDKAEPLVAKGATLAKTPAELASQCEVVLSCVYDAQAVEELVFGPNGIAQHNGTMKVFVDHASISPKATQAFAQRLQHACPNSYWLDAPVSGGTGGAEAGTLAIMVGGRDEDLQHVRPYLDAYAQRITLMGANGAGQTTKLCNQTIVASTIAVIAEAMRLATDEGVDASLLNEALAGGWADSTLLQLFVPRMSASEVPVTATLDTMLKDLDTVAALAQLNHTAMPVAHAVQQLYRLASKHELGDQDASQIIKILA